MKHKRLLLIAAGWISLILGVIGIVLPLLPTVPFFLLTVFCFGKSSERLSVWFKSTSLYEKYLASYVRKEGLTAKAKAGILIPTTLLMGFGIIMMGNVPIARAFVAFVWVLHIYYFVFRVKTIPEVRTETVSAEDSKAPETGTPERAPAFRAAVEELEV